MLHERLKSLRAQPNGCFCWSIRITLVEIAIVLHVEEQLSGDTISGSNSQYAYQGLQLTNASLEDQNEIAYQLKRKFNQIDHLIEIQQDFMTISQTIYILLSLI